MLTDGRTDERTPERTYGRTEIRTTISHPAISRCDKNWSIYAQDIARKRNFNLNQKPLLCTYLLKFIHLQSKTTPS